MRLSFSFVSFVWLADAADASSATTAAVLKSGKRRFERRDEDEI